MATRVVQRLGARGLKKIARKLAAPLARPGLRAHWRKSIRVGGGGLARVEVANIKRHATCMERATLSSDGLECLQRVAPLIRISHERYSSHGRAGI